MNSNSTFSLLKNVNCLPQRRCQTSKEPKKVFSTANSIYEKMIADYRKKNRIEELKPSDYNKTPNDQITVCIRKRPLNPAERKRNEIDVISMPKYNEVIMHEAKTKVDLTKYLENHHFRLDYVFDETADNDFVYKYTAKPLIKTVFEGGKATCFAYGQTGAGKTYTMGGEFSNKCQNFKSGIFGLVTYDVFEYIGQNTRINFDVSCTFFEIYGSQIFDLLNKRNRLKILEDKNQQVQVVNLTEKIVTHPDQVLDLIQKGNILRSSGTTSANSNSSRSHAIFQILIRYSGMNTVFGKFTLIDLAGNERGSDNSSSNRQTRLEGSEINKSLLTLKECIRALKRKGPHLPFRACKLTQILRDSFISDKSMTCMIALIAPGLDSSEHTLNTLRYSNRVKELTVTQEAGPSSSSIISNISPRNVRSSNNKTQDSSVVVKVAKNIKLPVKAQKQILPMHKDFNESLESILKSSKMIQEVTEGKELVDSKLYMRNLKEILTQLNSLTQKTAKSVNEYYNKKF